MRRIFLIAAIILFASPAHAGYDFKSYITTMIKFTDNAAIFLRQTPSKNIHENFYVTNNELRELKDQIESQSDINPEGIKLKINNIVFDLYNGLNLPTESIKKKTDEFISSAGINCEQIYMVSMAAMLVGVGLLQVFISFSDYFLIFSLFWGIIGIVIGLFGVFLAPIAIICIPFIFL